MIYDELHRTDLRWTGDPDPETDRLIRDLVTVENAAHQTMVIVGPWFEARIAHLVRHWLPEGWTTSGPSQVFDPERPGLRSRSWDIVVHRANLTGVPPEAAPGTGHPVLPKAAVAVVIDTKTNFSTPAAYATKPIFNLMNDALEPQLKFLGPEITKVLLIARSSRTPASLEHEGAKLGLHTFSLAQMRSGPVKDGVDRRSECVLFGPTSGEHPLQAFRATVLEAVAGHV